MADDDKTVFKPLGTGKPIINDDYPKSAQVGVELTVDLVDAQGLVIGKYNLKEAFSVGRALDNQIVIHNDTISRHHLEIKLEAGEWQIYNLKSANGVYQNGSLVQNQALLQFPAQIALGLSGIKLRIQRAHSQFDNPVAPQEPSVIPVESVEISNMTAVKRNLSQGDMAARLLAKQDTDDMGEYTLMVRRVIQQDQLKRGKSYKKLIWVFAGLFIIAASLVGYQQMALDTTRKLALDMFYDIKTLEVNLAQADIKLEEHAEVLDKALEAMSDEKLRATQEQLKLQQERIAAEKQHMRQERERLGNMKAKYRQYVEEANALRLSFPTATHYENELIAKVTRDLGESELEVPEQFVAEVRKYIAYWKASSRLQTAIDNLQQNDLINVVVSNLEKQGLPLYFIYLPLQESNYDSQAIGPETRFGIAKGAWQLLASTAQQYGVSPGPLAAVRQYDEQDGRFDFVQATQAGTKYLKHIYSTEAQASGLLVMASYNFGDNRVKSMIAKMPDNPRDRNFWKFLQQYELPTETRDYVFYIVSAAVIGEDPQHFGFKFNPPLYKIKS